MNKFKTSYIYTERLHETLYTGKVSKEKDSIDGFYVVVFRIDKNDVKMMQYKYLYYPKVFLNSYIMHSAIKQDFNKSLMFRDWGDYFVIFDDILCSELEKEVLINNLKYNDHIIEHIATKGIDTSNIQSTLDILKKTTGYTSDIANAIDMAASKDINNFLSFFLRGNFEAVSFDEDLYFIKDCVFVTPNLKDVLSKLVSLGYQVRKRYKSQSDLTDSSEAFLSSLDSYFRDSLYNYHYDKISSGDIPRNCLLPRSKFSFRNVHMNLGKVKSYSTLSVVNNREKLFEENYSLVGDLLKDNYYLGSEALQKEIEVLLTKQEQIFNDSNSLKKVLRYNNESYDFLMLKLDNICKLLDNILMGTDGLNVKFVSNKYIPEVKEILRELGCESVTHMLMSFYFSILTKETNKIKLDNESESVETPGLYSISCYNDFGKTIFNKMIYSHYIRSDYYKEGKSITDFIEFTKPQFDKVYKDNNSYALMGGYFVWNLVLVGLLEETLDRHPENRLHTTHYLRIPNNAREMFLVNKRSYKLPQKLPMICPPKKFIKVNNTMKLGGYLLNDESYSSPLIIPSLESDVGTVIRDENILIDMVNSIMDTPYKINTDVLNYIYEYGFSKGILCDSSSKDIQKFMSNPYGKYTIKRSKELRSMVSKILMEKNILSIADTYSKVPKIYFPVRLDYRTRIYANTDYFNYQKSDLSKGLLLFANPGVINKTDIDSINYFKAYGANMFGGGLDKKSLSTRIKWVDLNVDNILKFQSNSFIDKSENKCCFLAFCFEYKRFNEFLEDKEAIKFNTYLPIQLDATCNGYQHLALLTKEKDLFSKLNLTESTFDRDPGDFYKYVNDLLSEHINIEIKKLSAKDNKTELEIESLDRYKVISKLNLGRDILKSIIMRDSYSAGIPSLVENALSNESINKEGVYPDIYYTYKDKDVKFTRRDMFFYVTNIRSVISRIAPKIRLLSAYLNGIVRIFTPHKLPIPWKLPHGAEISQSYLKQSKHSIAAYSFTKSKYNFTKFHPGEYNSDKQRRALRPNLIHSLDATTIALLYASLPDNTNLYTVHDCFAVTSNNVSLLINKLKLVYLKLYSDNNYLIEFDMLIRLTLENVWGENIFSSDGKYITLPNKKRVLFPEVFPIVSPNVKLEEIKKSIYPIV